MLATPKYRAYENAPAEDTYVAVNHSGEILSVTMWRKKGERLPELRVDGRSVGYIRIGEVETTAKAA
jgi:hypothetical protein